MVVRMVLLFALASLLFGQNPALAPVEDVPGLPRVLIIGDSISIGYTLALREEMKGVANVHRPSENCAHTWKGLEKIDEWLGDGQWDVIHFNWGLHDLKYADQEGNLVPVGEGEKVSALAQYERNLDQLVRRLKQTGARLVWRPTTPVPPGANGRIAGDEKPYNEAALRVMKKHKVAVDDLNGLIESGQVARTAPDNVHFTPEGSAALAKRIAETLRDQLKQGGRGRP